MKKLRLLGLALAFIMAGCQYIDIKDGRVPAQYLSAAKAFEGVYKGNMEGIPGQIEIKFNEDIPRLSFAGENGNDLIHPSCQSIVGLLQGVMVDDAGNNTYKVTGADFAFNPGTCFKIQGRQVHLTFKENDGKLNMKVEILDHTVTTYNCHWEPGAPPSPGYPGGYPGYQVCNPVTYYFTRVGYFSK